MSWHTIYRSRLQSASEALSDIQPGSQIYLGGNAATPLALAEALCNRALSLDIQKGEALDVGHVLLMAPDPLASAVEVGAVRNRGYFVGSADRAEVANGTADYVPVHLH